MKRIAISVLTITVVALVGFAVTRAFFSDTETSTGNTITAGSIDISVDEDNPWSAPATISDNTQSGVPLINSGDIKLNPAHGQPGHRCDIKVGDPL